MGFLFYLNYYLYFTWLFDYIYKLLMYDVFFVVATILPIFSITNITVLLTINYTNV